MTKFGLCNGFVLAASLDLVVALLDTKNGL